MTWDEARAEADRIVELVLEHAGEPNALVLREAAGSMRRIETEPWSNAYVGENTGRIEEHAGILLSVRKWRRWDSRDRDGFSFVKHLLQVDRMGLRGAIDMIESGAGRYIERLEEKRGAPLNESARAYILDECQRRGPPPSLE